MKTLKTLFLLVPFLFASCGKHLIVPLDEGARNGGTLHLQPARSLNGTYLTVDGKLLVENKWVRKISITQIPSGNHQYHLICNNSNYKDKVDLRSDFNVPEGQAMTQLIEVPPASTGFWVYNGLVWLGTFSTLWISWAFLDEE